MLVENFIVPRVDESDFFRMYFKKNVLEFFRVRLLQKRSDAFIDEKISLFHLQRTQIRDTGEGCDVFFSQPAFWPHWSGHWDIERLKKEKTRRKRK